VRNEESTSEAKGLGAIRRNVGAIVAESESRERLWSGIGKLELGSDSPARCPAVPPQQHFGSQFLLQWGQEELKLGQLRLYMSIGMCET
jgi:hypothetical protein